jgi:release factor glutamine methyltransferase
LTAGDTAAVAARLRESGCVFAEDEARLLIAEAADPELLADLVERRCAGAPLEHVLGWAEFRGLRLAVAPGVFVPRLRTEFLVECVLAELPAAGCVLDLCCGCGAIGAAVRAARPDALVHAVDVDARAVACAEQNLGPGRVHHGDLFTPLPGELRGTVDVVVANAPYVPSAALPTMPAEARLHEPRAALDGGADGTGVQRRIVAAAPRWLRPGGRLLLETSAEQSTLLVAELEQAGLDCAVVRDADREATVVIGRRRGSAAQP